MLENFGPAIDYWVAPENASDRTAATAVAARLRRAGARVIMPLREQSLAKQMKAAATVQAGAVVIVDATETVRVKNMKTGAQYSDTVAGLAQDVEAVTSGSLAAAGIAALVGAA